jgi:hypothetical protein
MPANLTGATIADTYSQLLHLDGGPEATPKTVYSGTGSPTAMKIGTVSVEVENIKLDGNTISSVDTDGDLNFTPNGTGSVVISKVSFPDDAQARTALGLGTIATQDSDDVSITGGSITNVVFTGSFTGITLIESDKFSTKNGTDGVSLEDDNIFAEGTSADIDINITPKGTGEVNIAKVDIDAGTIDGTTVGATTPASVKGTTVQATTSLGYPTGTGGTVTQATSKSTGVTLDKVCGQITMNGEQLNRNTGVSFTLTNSFIAATDVIITNIVSGATANVYTATVDAVAAGSCRIQLHNHATGTDLSEAVVINFAVIKSLSA